MGHQKIVQWSRLSGTQSAVFNNLEVGAKYEVPSLVLQHLISAAQDFYQTFIWSHMQWLFFFVVGPEVTRDPAVLLLNSLWVISDIVTENILVSISDLSSQCTEQAGHRLQRGLAFKTSNSLFFLTAKIQADGTNIWPNQRPQCSEVYTHLWSSIPASTSTLCVYRASHC